MSPLQNPTGVGVHPVRMATIAMAKATAALMSDSTAWGVLETLAIAQLGFYVMAPGGVAMAEGKIIKYFFLLI